MSREFKQFLDENVICHQHVTPYWPQTTRDVLSLNKTLESVYQVEPTNLPPPIPWAASANIPRMLPGEPLDDLCIYRPNQVILE